MGEYRGFWNRFWKNPGYAPVDRLLSHGIPTETSFPSSNMSSLNEEASRTNRRAKPPPWTTSSRDVVTCTRARGMALSGYPHVTTGTAINREKNGKEGVVL